MMTVLQRMKISGLLLVLMLIGIISHAEDGEPKRLMTEEHIGVYTIRTIEFPYEEEFGSKVNEIEVWKDPMRGIKDPNVQKARLVTKIIVHGDKIVSIMSTPVFMCEIRSTGNFEACAAGWDVLPVILHIDSESSIFRVPDDGDKWERRHLSKDWTAEIMKEEKRSKLPLAYLLVSNQASYIHFLATFRQLVPISSQIGVGHFDPPWAGKR